MISFAAIFTPELAIAALGAILAGAVRGYSGFGANIVWAPILVLLFSPVETIAIMGLTGLMASIPMCFSVAKDTDWRDLSPVFVGLLLAAPLGVLTLLNVHPELVRRAIGGFVLLMGVIMLTGWSYRGPRTVPVRLGVGGVAGWIAGFVGVGGPIIVLYLMSAPGDARTQRANNTIGVAAMAPMVLIVMAFHGVIQLETVVRAVILLAPSLFGQWAGIRLFHGIPQHLFRVFVLVLLIGIGASVLFS